MEDPRKYLADLLQNSNGVVYVVQRSVSRSGMTRWIDLYTIVDNDLQRITYSTAKVLGWTYDKQKEALKITGYGMDMHFHTVYSLSAALYGYEQKNAYRLTHRTI